MKQKRAVRSSGRCAGQKNVGTASVAVSLALSFGCGIGAGLLLLSAFALAFERLAFSTSWVRPFAYAAATIGAAISGVVLSQRIGHHKLLCGAACGGFYALCLCLATVLTGEFRPQTDGLNCALLLLCGGIMGSAFSAVRHPSQGG